AVITILGFSISLTFVILLVVYVQKEYSVDQFHVNKDRIYRLVHDSYSVFAPPSGPLLADKFPEVAGYTRTYRQDGFISGRNNEKFKISYLMADSAFFSMFSFQLLEGRPETVLQGRRSIVLSRSYALNVFGKIPEQGELVKLDNKTEYRLSGIMADWPENTHFQKPDAIINFPSLADQWRFPQLLTTYDNPLFLVYAVLTVLLVGLIAGIIPALKISAFNPVEVIKGGFRMKEKSVYSRLLISFQYLLISSLLISALFIQKQTRFLRNYDLGFKKDQVLWIDNTIEADQLKTFKSILEDIPGVAHVCCVRGTPVDGGNNNTFDHNGKLISFQTFDVDTSFFSMMGMEVRRTGMALSDNIVWLNEAAVKEMELPENPVSVKIYGQERPVYGVVKNFHFRDLRQTIGPAYFQILNPDHGAWSILVKVSDKNVFETVNKIKASYHQFTHGLPLTMGFMDDSINKWYEEEERTGLMIGYFTLLTIVIAVMGLFAMSLYYVQQKVKEIGIRKVNGARISEVMAMLNKDFVRWVIIAFVIATPLAWFAMTKWLENFAYKTTLSWWIFALAGLLALGIALLTVSWQSWKAATKNPVASLRYE
ncbi:MAG: ABC transporter permease, partial [Prolixibacteraceae bacterium]